MNMDGKKNNIASMFDMIYILLCQRPPLMLLFKLSTSNLHITLSLPIIYILACYLVH